jgi:hypothetical protein
LPSSALGGSNAEDGNLRSVPLLFEPLLSGPVREAAVTLLCGGREGEVVRSWCETGDVSALVDVGAGEDAPLPAAAVVVPRDGDTMELARLVAPGPDGPDVTGRMLAALCDSLRRSDVTRVVVSTTNVEMPMMTVLQEAGFRFDAVQRDGCTSSRGLPPTVIDGIPARDLVWFDKNL